MNTEQREIKSAEWRKNNLSKNSVMDLLSNENMYKKSELHFTEIKNNLNQKVNDDINRGVIVTYPNFLRITI